MGASNTTVAEAISVEPRLPTDNSDNSVGSFECSTGASYLIALKDDVVKRICRGAHSTTSSTTAEDSCEDDEEKYVFASDWKVQGADQNCEAQDSDTVRRAPHGRNLAKPLVGALPTDAIKEMDGSMLVKSLAATLTHLATKGCRPQRITNFHSVRPPQIPIYDYLLRISKHFYCSDESLLVALIYIDRIMKRNPEFVVSFLNIHRVVALAAVVAVKYLEDVWYSNAHYARVGGVQVQELNKLEGQFLRLIGWRLHVLPEEYQRYRDCVMNAYQANQAKSLQRVRNQHP